LVRYRSLTSLNITQMISDKCMQMFEEYYTVLKTLYPEELFTLTILY